MVLELHVWGPAFSLPSIDAQCIAAIAYLSQAVPRGEWTLVASSDASISPTGQLPALRHNGLCIGGFRNIIDYLIKYSDGQYSLDADLKGLERADCTAYSSFVQSRGQELLDLSLYVSSQNYTTITRPIYSHIQTFPLPYITPPAIRARAKARTDHLGLSGLDVDSTDEAANQNQKSIIPESLRRPKHTLQGLLAQSENVARIRLEALVIAFCKPLQELRGDKRFFLSRFLTSLDCLALAYLSLALLPDLPNPWLATCMRNKFPMLCAFVHDLQNNFFGSNITLQDAGLSTGDERTARVLGKGKLPWKAPERASLLPIIGALGTNIIDHVPFVSQIRQALQTQDATQEPEDQEAREAKQELATMQKQDLLTTAGSIAAGVGLFVGFLFYQGLITLSSSEEELSDDENLQQFDGAPDIYSEVGSALDILSQQMDFENDQLRQRNDSLLEVDVEVEPIPDRTM